MRCHLTVPGGPFRPIATNAAMRLARVKAWSQQLPGEGGRPEVGIMLCVAGVAGATALTFSTPASQCYYEQRADGSVDRLKRWSSRMWNIPDGQNPSFHIKGVNPMLEKHLPRLVDGVSAREGSALSVLVPLCGKTWDLPYLCEQGFDVVGVEGVPRAIDEFRSEQRMRVKGFKSRVVLSPGPAGGQRWVQGACLLEPAEEFKGFRPGCVFKTGDEGLGYYSDLPAAWHGKVRLGSHTTRQLHIIEGDMFEVTPDLVATATFAEGGQFDIIYDRSALDALPPSARPEYAASLQKLLKLGGRILLVVLDYDQSQVPVDPTGKRRTPPPFSMPAPEIRRLFPEGSWTVECLDRREESELAVLIPAFTGVTVTEAVYLITMRRESGSEISSRIGKYIGGATLAVLGVGAALLMGRS